MDLLTWSCLSQNRARFVQKRGPFCPEARSVLSWNVVRCVLRRGPFCPETWSVLSGPFCPWSVLSEYRLTDRPGMTLDVYHGRKTTIQQQQQQPVHCVWRTWQVYRQHKSPLVMSYLFTDGLCVSGSAHFTMGILKGTALCISQVLQTPPIKNFTWSVQGNGTDKKKYM